jgi:hypothetical protein
VTSVLLLAAIVIGSALIIRRIRARRASMVSVRGFGPRADVERLRDLPRVRVDGIAPSGNDRVRLQLTSADEVEASEPAQRDLEFWVALNADDREYAILEDWLARREVLGIVAPADNRILRLRSIDDLQPITLRRVDD